MIPPDLINQLFVILIVLLSLMLGIWVYVTNRKQAINRVFLVMTIAFAGWVGFAYLSDFFRNMLANPAWILWSIRLAYASVAVSLAGMYYFSVYFPVKLPAAAYLKTANILVCIIDACFLFLVLFTNTLVSGFYYGDRVAEPIFGPWANFIYFASASIAALIMINFFRKYYTLPRQEKMNLFWVLVGLIILVGSNLLFNVAMPAISGHLTFYQLGNYSIIFFLGFTAYAITKRNLFGIKFALTAILVSVMAILLLLDATILTGDTATQMVKWVILAAFLFFGYTLIRSVLREVSLRKTLQRAYADLKQLDHAKSEFISVASHQLRTPLSAIKGYVSMMRKGDYGDVSPDMAEALEVLHESNERLVVLVNNMLNISRIESGRLQFRPRAMAIEPIIANTVNELTPGANGAGVRLIYRKPPALAREVFADPGLVHEILINLVDNGIKYTPRGGKVVVSLRPGERFLRTEIKDSGIGVVPETIPSLFKKFSRGQSGAKMHTNGAGLGLYIVKELVNLHKGRVGVRSAGPGRGSTFWFELPYDIM